jgi:predicted acylesterase/phospholipase RssA
MDHVLYFVANPSRAALDAAREGLDATARRVSAQRRAKVHFAFEQSAARALAKLRSGSADVVVIDARGEVGDVEESSSLALLRGLFGEHDLPRVVSRDKTWIVVGGDARGAAVAFEAGRLHLRGVIAHETTRDAARETGTSWEPIWERIAETMAAGRGGKIALCLAGGGTEGLFYELGVLRALEQFLPEYRLQDVDIICGISAGSILGGLLANGLAPRVIEAGFRGKSDAFEPIRRSDLFDPNVKDFAERLVRLSWDMARGRRSPLSALFRLAPAGVFAGKRLEEWLARQFARPNMTDRFDQLRHKLFVGATDQDSGEHVVFGATDAPKVPIHRAIRASTALAPFYAPAQIDGRWYIDGGFTRTTNMRVAVQEGATLVILIDPVVPIATKQAGHVAEHGAIYSAMQGLKSLIHGRFDKAIPTLRAMYPQVAFHLFQPGPDTLRVMAGSPMKYFFRDELVEMAFRETTREIRSSRMSQLTRDFDRHGVSFRDHEAPPDGSVLEQPYLRVVA